MSGWYIYIIAAGIGFITVAGLVLQIKANRQFGLLKSWLIPFEEVLYCFRNWSSASLVAKFCLFGIILIALGFILRATGN